MLTKEVILENGWTEVESIPSFKSFIKKINLDSGAEYELKLLIDKYSVVHILRKCNQFIGEDGKPISSCDFRGVINDIGELNVVMDFIWYRFNNLIKNEDF